MPKPQDMTSAVARATELALEQEQRLGWWTEAGRPRKDFFSDAFEMHISAKIVELLCADYRDEKPNLIMEFRMR